jgi:tetratricopeptide (TPR) repeat protein
LEPDNALRQAQKAIQLCEKYPNNEYARQSYIYLALCYQQNVNIDSFKATIQKAKAIDKNRSNILYFFLTYILEAYVFILEGQLSDAIEIINNIEKEFSSSYSIPLNIATGFIKAKLLSYQAKYDEVISLYQELVSLSIQINSPLLTSKMLIAMCHSFLEQGKIDGAKYSLFQAQNIASGLLGTGSNNSIQLLQAMTNFADGDAEKSLSILLSLPYIKLKPMEKIKYKILSSQIYFLKGEYRKSLSFLTEDAMLGKQFLSLPSVSYLLNMNKANILMELTSKTFTLSLAQKTLFMSKHGLLGQDLHGQIKQALDIAYINTLYSGDRTQQPKAAFELAKYYCMMTFIEPSNAQNHKDECIRLLEMAYALANELNLSTLIIRIQNLELALKSGNLPVGI